MYESRCLVFFVVSGNSGPVVHSAVWCWRQDSHPPAWKPILHCVAMYVVLFAWHYCVKFAILSGLDALEQRRGLSEWEVHNLGMWYQKDKRKGFLCSLPLPKPRSALVLRDTLNPLVYPVTSSHNRDGLHTSRLLTNLQISCSVLNIPKHLRDTQDCGCACKYMSLHKPFCSYASISIQGLVMFSSYHYGTQARVECFIFYSLEGQHLAMWLSMTLNSRCCSLSLQSMAIADVYWNAWISGFFVVSLIYPSNCPFFILVH
jgi:hypothetical protein